MPVAWRTVRVFISSTFRDMHAERDWLVKRIFPALRERLEPHRVHLIDIDLRWGITEEQSENDQVLDVCLDQIDECRPFFVGLLGERYGWVPESLPDGSSKYGWTQQHTGKSVTELEIRWGVLLKPEMHSHGIFFFRDPMFANDVPDAKRDEVLAERPESASKLAALKQAIRDARLPIPIVENYPCRFAGLRINWRLARFDLNVMDQRALEAVAADGLVDNHEYDRLDERLREIVHRYGVVYLDGLEEFGREVLERLWSAISAELKLDQDTQNAKASDSLAEELAFHERFIESRLRVYVGRESLQDELARYADGDDPYPAVVTGSSGTGKSAALAKFVREYSSQHPEVLVIPHFIGASPTSNSLRKMIQRLCHLLRGAFEFIDVVPADMNSLIAQFRQFVEQVPAGRRVVLVIDALNQLDETDDAHTLHWLQRRLPPHVKVIASCIADGDRANAVLKAIADRPHHRVGVQPLTNQERFEIVARVPSLSAKSLSRRQIQLLLENPATTNPLFLLVALEELRGFGSYEQLNRRIESFPNAGDPVTELFGQVIDRLQDEFEPDVVCQVLSLLAAARRGLSDRELLDLIEGDAVGIEESRSDLFPVLRQLGPYLQHRGELWDFFHRNLDKAVTSTWLADESTAARMHRRLAEYFAGQQSWLTEPGFERSPHLRKVDELPWQRLKAQQWDELEQTLCDFDFIEAKCVAGMLYELLTDLRDAIAALPESQGELHGELDWRQRLAAYAAALAEFARHRDEPSRRLPAPPGTTEVEQLADSAAAGSQSELREHTITRVERLKALAQFFDTFSYVLVQAPAEVVPLARNHADSGPVAECAEPICERLTRVWVKRDCRPRPAPLNPVCVRTMYGHKNAVDHLAVSADALVAVSASWSENGFCVWDLASGRLVARVGTDQAHRVSAIALNHNGSIAVLSGVDVLQVWDLRTLELVRSIQPESRMIQALALTPDARTLVAANHSGTLDVWDLPTGSRIRALTGHGGKKATSVAVSADGQFCISAGDDESVRVWEIVRGVELHCLGGHAGPVRGVAMTPSGDRAVSVGEVDESLRVWNPLQGQLLQAIHLNSGKLTSLGNVVAITANGRMAMTVGSKSDFLGVWQLESGRQLRHIRTGLHCSTVAASTDGRLVATSGFDQRIRLWDLRSPESLQTYTAVTAAEEEAQRDGSDTNVLGTAADLYGRFNLHLLREGADTVVLRLDARDSAPRELRVQWPPPSLQLLPGSRTMTGAVTTDGRTVAALEIGGKLRIWDMQRGVLVRELDAKAERLNSALCFTADNAALVMGHSGAFSNDEMNGCISLWDLRTGERLRRMIGNSVAVKCVSPISNSPRILVAGGFYLKGDFAVRVLDTQTGQTISTLHGHEDEVLALTVAARGRIAVSASRDHTLRVWDLETSRQLAVYVCGDRVQKLSPIDSAGRLRCRMRSRNYHSLTLENISPEEFKERPKPDSPMTNQR